ncbi:hypothetical protein K504DRAFT_465662 [Pleomassaria siparia CBS 279.74]|uniref:Uncharacterized protein n=1 Tax=Pleomassaria siparia CBS 279.74 TaxID=1314801 RepID=A0A6G1KHU9_9PLEO|nr:hypothetical protein K504DRAFT_465662 [Pleomassaria siparia CBS 279.74]
MTAPKFAAVPYPGLSVFEGYAASQTSSFKIKAKKVMSSRENRLVSRLSPTGEECEPFLEVYEKKRKHITFQTMAGEEVMTIVKVDDCWSLKGLVYHGMRPDCNRDVVFEDREEG